MKPIELEHGTLIVDGQNQCQSYHSDVRTHQGIRFTPPAKRDGYYAGWIEGYGDIRIDAPCGDTALLAIVRKINSMLAASPNGFGRRAR